MAGLPGKPTWAAKTQSVSLSWIVLSQSSLAVRILLGGSGTIFKKYHQRVDLGLHSNGLLLVGLQFYAVQYVVTWRSLFSPSIDVVKAASNRLWSPRSREGRTKTPKASKGAIWGFTSSN
jgi:hypothetical protein